MTKSITKPIKKIVKPVTSILGGKSKKQPSQPTAPVNGNNNDPRMNMSEQDILASRKKKARGRINPSRETSLLDEGNLPQTIG